MTAKEIREQVTPLTIWMADAAIREARKAITGKTSWNDIKRHPYNLPEVEMAGEVLFNMFEAHTNAIREALLSMPAEMDGIRRFRDRNYFDEFVKALNTRSNVKLREADWVLNLC